jgi:hypothetical protein
VLKWTPRPGFVVDHINGDPLDNRKSNLRVCTQAENLRNRRKRAKPTSSKFKGVSRHTISRQKPWLAKIKSDGKTIYLGTFETEEQAAEAYDRAALERFGTFAHLNRARGAQ